MHPMTVAVAGASGYAGGELLRLLADHPAFEVVNVSAGGRAGQRVTDVHPHLGSYGSWTFTATEPGTLGEADVVFLALPHGQSGALAAELPGDRLVVDLGADHRLADPGAWRAYYGSEHAGTWLYGLPELPGVRKDLPGQTRIANPGCYATAIICSLWPLLRDRVVQPQDLVAVAASGTSGAGRTPTDGLLATEVQGSMRAYKVGGVHQHTPEIEQSLNLLAAGPVSLGFTPLLAPMSRGILVTATAKLAAGTTSRDLRGSLEQAYADEPFVRVLEPDHWPATAATCGTNAVHLQVAPDDHAGRAIIVAAMDNLGKGAAGQAVQNANLALGLPESTALTVNGVAP